MYFRGEDLLPLRSSKTIWVSFNQASYGCFFDNSVFVATTGISYKASLMEEFRKLSLNELRNFDYSILNLNNLNFNNDIHASADYRKSLLINKLPILISELLKNE